jgi:hypothetical protein
VNEYTAAAKDIPSSCRLPPYPVRVAASTTDVETVSLSPAAVTLIVALSAPANITALTITAAGSGAVLAAYAAAPTRSYIVVPVAPAIDPEVVISVTCGVGAACTVTVAESYAALGEQLT